MRPFPIFTVLLVLVITLVVFVPHFPHLVEAAAAEIGVAPEEVLAVFVVVMLIAAIFLSVLTVREVCGFVRSLVAEERRARRT